MVWDGADGRPGGLPHCARHTHLGRYTATLFGALTKLSQP